MRLGQGDRDISEREVLGDHHGVRAGRGTVHVLEGIDLFSATSSAVLRGPDRPHLRVSALPRHHLPVKPNVYE